ncbi:MAG: LysR family transcriptional regulator [Rhodanobacteraceae bacterium]
MPEQQDLNDLAYFAWVVDAGGFAPAGRRHGVPKSKLSRRIKALEERLGVRLLQRSTRRFSVTSTGETFYRHCKAVLQEAEAAHEAVNLRHGEPCGVVRLSCPVTLLHFAIGDMLNDFLRMYPRVSVELDADNRRVDVIGEGMDVALRVRFPPLKDSDLVMRKLGASHQILVATPTLLDELGRPSTPEDLARLPSLATKTHKANPQWQLLNVRGEERRIEYSPRLVSDDMHALRQAALAGLGVVQLPVMAIREPLAAGALERVLPEWAPPPGVVHAVFASRRGMLPAVRKLVDFLAEKYQVHDVR